MKNKRILLALLIAMLAAGGAFSQDFKFSAGAGGMLGGDFGGGVTVKAGGESLTYDIPNFGTGFYGFVDVTYAEAFFSVFSPTGAITSTYKDKTTGLYTDNNQKPLEGEWTYSMVTFGVLGKYPIILNDMISIFPALGIDYRMVSSITYSNWKINDPQKFNALWFLGGAGMDFNLPIENVPLYVRLEVLYGIRLQNKWEDDAIAEAKKIAGAEATPILGNGLTAKLAVGWKF